MVSIEKMNYSNSIEFYVRATGAWLLFFIFNSNCKILMGWLSNATFMDVCLNELAFIGQVNNYKENFRIYL